MPAQPRLLLQRVGEHPPLRREAGYARHADTAARPHRGRSALRAGAAHLRRRAGRRPDINDGGYVPKQVIAFLNNEHNRSLIRGVIAAGNNNFGAEFAYAGDVVSRKCGVPYLYRFELMGTPDDVDAVRAGLADFWKEQTCHQPSSCRACNHRRARVARRDGLPRAQRDAESVRRRRQDSVRQGPRGRASVLPAARQPEHGVLPQSGREARLPDQGELLRA